MAAIANEIALVRPHLVGLQEVTRLFTQFPSDTVLGNFTPNATDQQFDYLATLQDELAARGLDYEVAAEQQGTDIELPRFDGVVEGNPSFTEYACRSPTSPAPRDVPATLLVESHYQAALPIPPIPTCLRRTWSRLATVDGARPLLQHPPEPLIPGVPDTSQPQFAGAIWPAAGDVVRAGPDTILGDFNRRETHHYQAGMAATPTVERALHRQRPGLHLLPGLLLTHPDRAVRALDLMCTQPQRKSGPAAHRDQAIFRHPLEAAAMAERHAVLSPCYV